MEIEIDKKKCIGWLKNKCELLRDKLEEVNASTTAGSKLAATKIEKDKQKIKNEAFEMVGQYLPSSVSEALRKELALSSPLDSTSENKRPKTEIAVE